MLGFELLGNAAVLDGVAVKEALAPTVVLTRIEYDNDGVDRNPRRESDEFDNQ